MITNLNKSPNLGKGMVRKKASFKIEFVVMVNSSNKCMTIEA